MNPSISIRFRALARCAILVGFLGTTMPMFAAPVMKTLHGHVPAVTSQLSPSGLLLPTTRLSVAIGLILPDSKGLDDYLAQVYNPGSPYYRQYLTPEEFTERFGPTKADYEAVLAF